MTEEEYLRRMKMQPALGTQREQAKDRQKTGINKGVARRKEGSDEEINQNSSSWDETESDEQMVLVGSASSSSSSSSDSDDSDKSVKDLGAGA